MRTLTSSEPAVNRRPLLPVPASTMALPGSRHVQAGSRPGRPSAWGEVNPIDRSTVIEPIRLPLWAWLTAAFAVLVVYSLTLANGAALANHAGMVHEFVHDARHLLGVPCH